MNAMTWFIKAFRRNCLYVFEFLSVINYGHGKIPIVFQQDSKLAKGGWVFVIQILDDKVITTNSLNQSVTMQKTFYMINITQYISVYDM